MVFEAAGRSNVTGEIDQKTIIRDIPACTRDISILIGRWRRPSDDIEPMLPAIGRMKEVVDGEEGLSGELRSARWPKSLAIGDAGLCIKRASSEKVGVAGCGLLGLGS